MQASRGSGRRRDVVFLWPARLIVSGLGGRNKVCSDGQLGVEVTLIPVSLGTLRHTSR